MKNLSVLCLNNNNIVGQIPLRIGHITHLRNLDLRWNQINGSIPIEITNCYLLEHLSLSHNHLTGSIPFNIGDLNTLNHDLSYNSLTGNVPISLIYLSDFNSSYNSFEGQIPNVFTLYEFNQFISNKDLCGDIIGYVPCPPSTKTMHLVKIWVPLSLFFVLILFGYIFHSWSRVRKTQSRLRGTKNGNLFSIWNYDGKITYEDIIEATKDFDIRYCIGIGGYGSVYKAQLPNGKVVALKKLHHLEAEDPNFDKSFKNEIKMLTEI